MLDYNPTKPADLYFFGNLGFSYLYGQYRNYESGVWDDWKDIDNFGMAAMIGPGLVTGDGYADIRLGFILGITFHEDGLFPIGGFLLQVGVSFRV